MALKLEQKELIKKIIAGGFFVLSIVLLTGFVFVLGVEKGLTEPKFGMTVVFHKVGGLAVGAPVRLSGVTVGTVADIDFLEQEIEGRGVRVGLSLFKKFEQQVHKSTSFAIITEGVLGEKIVEITTDAGQHRADLSQPVIGEDPLDVQNLAETFGEAALVLLENSKTIENITKELRYISVTTKRLLNRIEQRIIDGTLFKVF